MHYLLPFALLAIIHCSMAGLNFFLFNLIFDLARKNALLDFSGIFFAQYLPYILTVGTLWIFIHQAGWRRRLFLFSELILAIIVSRGLITELIRFFYPVARPFAVLHFTPLIPESAASFPSGHMTYLFALSFIVFLYRKKWGYWYFILSALVGIARIFAGVHWPFDIAGGAIIGIASAIGLNWLLADYRKQIASENSEHFQESVQIQ